MTNEQLVSALIVNLTSIIASLDMASDNRREVSEIMGDLVGEIAKRLSVDAKKAGETSAGMLALFYSKDGTPQ